MTETPVLSPPAPLGEEGFFLDPDLLTELQINFDQSAAKTRRKRRPEVVFVGAMRSTDSIGVRVRQLFSMSLIGNVAGGVDPDGDPTPSPWVFRVNSTLGPADGPPPHPYVPPLADLPRLAFLRLKWIAEALAEQAGLAPGLDAAGRPTVLGLKHARALAASGQLHFSGAWIENVQQRELASGLMTEGRAGVARAGRSRVGVTADTEGMNPTKSTTDPKQPKTRLQISYRLSEYCDPDAVAEAMGEFTDALSELHRLNGGSGLRLVKTERFEGIAAPEEVKP